MVGLLTYPPLASWCLLLTRPEMWRARGGSVTLSAFRDHQRQPCILHKVPREPMGNNEDNLEDWTLLCFWEYSQGYLWEESYVKLPRTQLFWGNNRSPQAEAMHKCLHISSSPHLPFCLVRLPKGSRGILSPLRASSLPGSTDLGSKSHYYMDAWGSSTTCTINTFCKDKVWNIR